jgi:hypothetical protein
MFEDVINILQEYQKQVTPKRIQGGLVLSGLLKACNVDTTILDDALDALQKFDPQSTLDTLYWIERHPIIKRMIERRIT